MRKSIFDKATQDEVFARLEKLTENTVPQWGIMKPNQVLRHIIEGNKITLGELQSVNKSNFFTRTLIRYFTLNAMVPSKSQIAKRPIATFPEINVIEKNIPVADFATEKKNFIADTHRVINAEKFATQSPLLGKMSKQDWGHLTYSHINYHFTQFGI